MITGPSAHCVALGIYARGMATKRSAKPLAGHRALVWGASHRLTYHRRPQVPQLCGLTDVRPGPDDTPGLSSPRYS